MDGNSRYSYYGTEYQPGQRMVIRDKIKETILRLLDEYSADDLSVKLLCMEAGISKQTLYNNFYGIVEVIEELVTEMIHDAVGDYLSDVSWYNGIKKILNSLYARKERILHLYNSKYRESLIRTIYENVRPVFNDGIDIHVRLSGIVPSERDRELLIDFYMDIYMGAVTRFIRNEMEEDIEYIAEMYNCLLEQHTSYALKNIAGKESNK